MGQTNEFERDLENQAMLKRPGRIDLRIFQNTSDAGDGKPGLQRCFRNYLHEGGMEKDIDLLGYSIKGTSVDINNAELQQLSNIGSSVISAGIWSQLDNIEATIILPPQWVFVGEADQPVKQTDSPTFVGLTLTANLVTSSTIDGVDVLGLKTSYDAHLHDAQTLQFDGVNSNGGGFSFTTTGQVTFNQDVQVANLITAGLVDSVDVLGLKNSYDTHVGNANAHISNLTDITTRNHDSLNSKDANSSFLHSTTTEQTNWNSAHTHITQNGSSHGYINQSITTGASPVFVGLTLTANLVTSSTVDGVNVSAHNHSGDGQGGTIDHAELTNVLTSQHHTKYTDAEALAASYTGLPSTEVVHSSDSEVYGLYMNIWAKLKEITIYDSIKCDVYYEFKSTQGSTVYSRLRRNGIEIGTEHSTTSATFQGITESDLIFVRGDTLELWGKKNNDPNNLILRYLRIKFKLYDNTL